ncbi:MAG: Asp23/Gls24 family envelope stress response protein [Ruminiclostridium sp.]|nr:Asp23/Gls24 family envelope stress response protein [Ruminiclostridium sp.]
MENNVGTASGTLRVSAGVVMKIAETAAAETEGVAISSAGKLAVISGAPLTAKLVSPVRVRMNGDSTAIEIEVITEIAYKAYEVAKNIQEHVKSAVQNMTGITVSKVNVRIVAVKGK